jgi:hypothetical protein
VTRRLSVGYYSARTIAMESAVFTARDDDPVARPGLPLMASPNRAHSRYQSFGAAALYFAVAVLLLDRGLIGHPGYYVGRDTDPPVHMWFFNWWRFSISHRLNPFITDWVWAPLGINLAWTTCVPLLAWISIPLQLTVGEPGTYNIIATLALPIAALGAFLLCRRVTAAFWPSVLGGYVFGFSPYMLGEVLGHLVLIAVFPVPLVALLTLKRLDGEISARRFALLLAALLIVQFLCSVELFATVTMVGGFALLLALVLFGGNLRARLSGLIAPTIAAYLIAGAVLSPYLFYMLGLGFPHSPIWTPGTYSADLLAFLVPTETILLGTAHAATSITQTFQGDLFENGAYLGIAMIVFIELFRRRYWRMPAGKFLTILFVVIVIAAVGPTLHIAGRESIWMPWALAGRLPLISIALPARLMMYAFLVVAVMVAMWFATSTARPLTKCAAAAAIILSIAPNPNASFWISKLDVPAFFTDGTYAKELSPREIVLPLPWGQQGNSMYWQLQSDMYFRMAGGWTGLSPFEFTRTPVANYFYGGIDLPEAGDQLKAYLARFDVDSIVADPTEANFPFFQQTLASLNIAPAKDRGVWIYKIPHGAFASYRGLSGGKVEARANALRFYTILEAAAKYLTAGNDTAKISPLELKRMNLLPNDWQVDATPHAYTDWLIGPSRGGRVGIIIVGSYEGVKPLIDRYSATSSEIQYPAPTRWTPDSNPRRDAIKPLLIIFDSARLQAAANELRSSPPRERTTPFIAGTSR